MLWNTLCGTASGTAEPFRWPATSTRFAVPLIKEVDHRSVTRPPAELDPTTFTVILSETPGRRPRPTRCNRSSDAGRHTAVMAQDTESPEGSPGPEVVKLSVLLVVMLVVTSVSWRWLLMPK